MRVALPLVSLGLFLASSAIAAPPPTAEDAKAFVEAAEARLLKTSVLSSHADWVNQTFITDDTDILSAAESERNIAATVELAKEATRFDGLKLPEDVARKLKLLRLSLPLAAPSDPKKGEELTRLVTTMGGRFGKGKVCLPGKECLTQEQVSEAMATSRDPKALAALWTAWHDLFAASRPEFARYVAL